MARIPQRIAGQRLDTGSVVRYPDGSPIGQSLQGAGDAGMRVAAHVQQRQAEDDDYQQRQASLLFREQLNIELQKSEDTMAPDGKGLADGLAGEGIDLESGVATKPGIFDERAKTALESMTSETAKQRFQQSLPALRLSFYGQAREKEVATRRGFQATQLEGLLGKLQNSINQTDPDNVTEFQSYKEEGKGLILSTSLTANKKNEILANWNKITAKTSWLALHAKDPNRAKAALGITGASENLVDRIVGVESGGAADAKNPNSSAQGAAQFISSTWVKTLKDHEPQLAEGRSRAQILEMRNDPALSRRMTEHLIQDNTAALTAAGVPVNDGSLYLAHFAGAEGATKVLRAIQTGNGHQTAVSILGETAVAANPFLKGMTAADLSEWASKKVGGGDAPGQGDRADPRFQDIPLSDRMALVADADTASNRALADVAAEQKRVQEVQLNDLKLGIIDGKAGLSEIQKARESGWLSDADQINSLTNLYETKNKDSLAEMSVVQRVSAGGSTFDPADGSEDRKAIDRIYDKSVEPQSLAQGNQSAATGLFGLWRETGIMPKRAKGDIAGMLRSPAVATNTTALSYLDALEHDRPDAFAREFDENTDKALATYRANLDYYSADEIAKRLKQSSDPQQAKARESLKKEVQPEIDKMTFDDLAGTLDTSWLPLHGEPEAPVQSDQRAVFLNDYKALLADQYSETGDMGRAQKEAMGRLQRVWGTSETNGGRLMKLPPEYFYPAIDQSFEWMKGQVETDLKTLGYGKTENALQAIGGNLATETLPDYGLVADDKTDSDRAGGKYPSYQLWVMDEDGLPIRALDKTGRDVRIIFDPAKANAEKQIKREQNRTEMFAPDTRAKSALELGVP